MGGIGWNETRQRGKRRNEAEGEGREGDKRGSERRGRGGGTRKGEGRMKITYNFLFTKRKLHIILFTKTTAG